MLTRRRFIQTSAATLACFPAGLQGLARQQTPGQIEKRALGKTGEMLSAIGFGGIVVTNATTREAADRVAEAIDYGVNYFDVAPSYGNAEQMLGPALEPYRSRVFLACKTQARDRVGALKELDESLGRMRTDHFDLYQFHAVTKVEDVRKIFGPDGAMEAFQQAKQAGKIRYLGFSAHSVEAATALMDQFDFDTILFPFNYGTWHAGNFGPQVLERAKSKQMGLLALKAMAKGPWLEGAQRDKFPKCWYEPFSTEHEVSLGLRFTLSHPITSAVPPGDENLFRMAMQEAVRFRPLEAREAEELKRMASAGKPLFSYPSTSA